MTSAPQRATLLCVAGIVLLALPTVVTSRIAAEPDLGSPVQDVRQGLADGSGTKAAVAAEAALHHRRLLQAEGEQQRQPLPNFEIGVAAPPAAPFREWQASGVRERTQELSSSSFLTPGHPGLGYVAICVVARDAHADMLEWVSHHVRLGVSKIYLWDHASVPPMRNVVQGYIAAGLLEYQHFDNFQHASGKPQLYAYEQCLQRGHLHTWMAFIDVDEFLMFRDPWPPIQSLPAFLATFEGPQAPPAAVSGVAVHWLIFGSSGHESRPPGGVLRSYHRCLPLRHAQHALVKTIVRTACTAGVEGPHNFAHNCSQPVLQTDRTPILGARSEEPVHSRLALHHYAVKSREEFALKMVRGSAMKRQRGWEFFDFVDEWSIEHNFDGATVWDTVTTFLHYPAMTRAHVERYEREQHEDFWLKGLDDPRLQQQQQAEAAAAADAAQEAAKQQQQQQTAAAAAAAAVADATVAQRQGQADAAAGAAGVADTAATQHQQQRAAAVDAAAAVVGAAAGLGTAADQQQQQEQQQQVEQVAAQLAAAAAGGEAATDMQQQPLKLDQQQQQQPEMQQAATAAAGGGIAAAATLAAM